MTDGPQTKDWGEALQRFADTLAAVEQRLVQATSADADPADAASADRRLVELTHAARQHAELANRFVEISHWVDAIEAELRVSEDLMRVLLTQTEAVRQKLATWAGRAIG